jgi:hypothetical protein
VLRIRDPVLFYSKDLESGSGIQKNGWIRDKHPGSATLEIALCFWYRYLSGTYHHLVHDNADAPPVDGPTIVVVLQNLVKKQKNNYNTGTELGGDSSVINDRNHVLQPYTGL